MPLGLTFFRTRRQIILKHADLRTLRRIAAFLLVVLSIAGIAACTVPEEVFPPDTPTAAISDVLHTTEPTEIGTAAEIELSAKPTAPPQEPTSSPVKESGEYSSRDEVALYIHLFGHLPANFITKKQARELGWQGGGLQDFAPGLLHRRGQVRQLRGAFAASGRKVLYRMRYRHLRSTLTRAKRIVFSNDGLFFIPMTIIKALLSFTTRTIKPLVLRIFRDN